MTTRRPIHIHIGSWALLALLTSIFVSPAAAQQAESMLPKLSRVGAYAGMKHVPNRWGILALDVANPSPQPTEVLVATYFQDHPDAQFGRRLWVPANAKRYSWFPVQSPKGFPQDQDRAEVISQVEHLADGERTLLKTNTGEMLHSSAVITTKERAVIGLIAAQGTDESADESFHAVIATRLAANLPLTVTQFYGDYLPPIETGLDGIDQLVIASDRVLDDLAGLVAIRRWLRGGGRLWIMLDQVDPDTVGQLLGEDFACQIVDRIGLTEVQFEDASATTLRRHELREHEQPVEFVRVLPSDVEIVHTVNGWPASFWQPIGRGRVLYTTLGPRGWMRRLAERDVLPEGLTNKPKFVATLPLEELAAELFMPRDPPPLATQEFAPMIQEQIGYQIVGRVPVLLVLGSFCVLLMLAAAWLWRRGRLSHLSAVTPLFALAASGVLLALGAMTKHAAPPTAAVTQFVEVSSGGEEVQINGLLALYHQDESESPLGAQRGGVFLPDTSGLQGLTRRMIWTDLGAWQWERLSLPPGVRTADLSYSTQVDDPILARGQFGPQGLSGFVLAGPLAEVGDAILVTPTGGVLAAELSADHRFEAGANEVLAANQFVAGNLLSDRQQRRQLVYRALFARQAEGDFNARTTLYLWAEPLDLQLLLPPEARKTGAALVAVPLKLDRTPPGTRVVIPSPFISFRSVAGAQGGVASAAYDYRKRRWIPLKSSANVWLRFELPPSVLPLDVDEARLNIDIKAPNRQMQILGMADGDVQQLAARQSPMGSFLFTLTDSRILQLDDRGGLLLGISVGDTGSPDSHTGWNIENVTLQVTGTTRETTAR